MNLFKPKPSKDSDGKLSRPKKSPYLCGIKNEGLMKHFLSLLFCLYGIASWGQNSSAYIESLIKEILPPGSDVGICAYDLTEGKVLCDYRADKLSRPASTMKLLTAITYLKNAETKEKKVNPSEPAGQVLFSVKAYADGTISKDTLHGDLYVEGLFHPLFDGETMDLFVDRLVKQTSQPIRVIQGNVYADISRKDSVYWGKGWAWDDNPAGYQPYLSPLMFNNGMVKVTVRPSIQKGNPATVTVMPASPYYTVRNLTKSHTPSAGKLTVTRNWLEGGNEIIVSGNARATRTEELNLHDSGGNFFMQTFIHRMRAAGVQLPAAYGFRPISEARKPQPLADMNLSTHLALKEMLLESNNGCAESMFYALGTKNTSRRTVKAADGIEKIEELIRELGHDPKAYRIADGSGLSNYNYLSPALLVDFLKYAYTQPEILAFLRTCLPVAGVNGTLSHRMKNTPAHNNVQAKTGTVTGISTLAGYVKRKNGNMVAFAIMNQNILSGSKARNFQDKVCLWLIGQ